MLMINSGYDYGFFCFVLGEKMTKEHLDKTIEIMNEHLDTVAIQSDGCKVNRVVSSSFLILLLNIINECARSHLFGPILFLLCTSIKSRHLLKLC